MPYRWFLQNWLRALAGQTLRQAVAGGPQPRIAAERQTAEQGAGRLAGCDVGVVFALTEESGGLEDLLEDVVATRGDGFTVRQGRLGQREVVLAVSGAGREAAARAADALILGHRPAWVISSGFSGGLTPQVGRHDIVIADSLTDAAGNVVQLAPGCPVSPSSGLPPQVHVGRLLTADRIARRPGEKKELGEKHQALAVDLESLAAAEVCRRHGVPLLVIRVVSDAWDDELPREVERLTRHKTWAARWGAALGAILRRPAVVRDLYRLKAGALRASDRLARFLTQVIEHLGPQGEGSGVRGQGSEVRIQGSEPGRVGPEGEGSGFRVQDSPETPAGSPPEP